MLHRKHRLALFDWMGIDVTDQSPLFPEELAGTTLRADMLVGLEGDRLAQVEIFYKGETIIGQRMLGYLVRLWERFPELTVEQHVVVLGRGL
jgi:hypothetical protein